MLKLAIFAGLLYVLLKRWLDEPLSPSYLLDVFNQPINVVYFSACLLLILPNWLVEAHLWQKLLRPIISINISASLKSVLSGLTLGILTPFMTGDYLGRVANLPTPLRKEGIGANLTGSYIFTLLSIHLGAIGLTYYLFFVNQKDQLVYAIFMYSLWIASVFGVFILFSPAGKLLSKVKFLKPYLTSFLNYKKSDFVKFYLIALFRYLIFIFQFVLLFWAFEVHVPIIPMIGGILLIFLAKTIGSGINIFGDLTTREVVGIGYFNLFQADSGAVAWVIFLLWLLNIIIPAFGGLVVLWKIKNFSFKSA